MSKSNGLFTYSIDVHEGGGYMNVKNKEKILLENGRSKKDNTHEKAQCARKVENKGTRSIGNGRDGKEK